MAFSDLYLSWLFNGFLVPQHSSWDTCRDDLHSQYVAIKSPVIRVVEVILDGDLIVDTADKAL